FSLRAFERPIPQLASLALYALCRQRESGYLAGNDLASVALVTRSCSAGVIPRLYYTLQFRVAHAKRYPTLMSTFCAVAAHPLCRTTSRLPPLLSAQQQKDRLRRLRVHANLSPSQAARLARLPTFARSLSTFNLTSLTLYLAHGLNADARHAARGSRAAHRWLQQRRPRNLSLVSHTLLIFDKHRSLPEENTRALPFLRSLALEARLPPGPLPHPQAPLLKTLTLVDCAPGTTDSRRRCVRLERLDVAVLVRDLGTRLTHYRRSSAPRPRAPVIDLAPHTHTPAVRPALALALMASVPRLRTVVTGRSRAANPNPHRAPHARSGRYTGANSQRTQPAHGG
ncbi:hypothetical protein FB451DRAFT_1434258, partial [Mycena latifolia]